MENSDALIGLKKVLSERFPEGYNYAPELAGILGVHPKTVVRKLRGESQFTLEETVEIFNSLGIPFNNFKSNGAVSGKYPMEIFNLKTESEDDSNKMLLNILETYRSASRSGNSRYYAGNEWCA